MDTRGTQYDTHYESGGFGYDRERAKHQAWLERNYVKEFGLRPGSSLLDVGCGDGFWASLFAEAGLIVTGIDVSEGGVRVARERTADISVLVASVEQPLPFEPGTFDVVFVRNLSHMCREDLEREVTFAVMHNLLAVVRPAGFMLVSQYSRLNGATEGAVTHHSLSDMVRLFEQVGDIFKLEVVQNHVLIGVRPPRRSPTAAGAPPA